MPRFGRLLRDHGCRFLRIVRLNNVTRFRLVLLAILATSTCGWANLGDSSERVDDSYGNLVQRRLRDDGTVSVLYHKDRYLYEVVVANGRSVSETYFHMNGTDLSEKEITRFLQPSPAAGLIWATATTKLRIRTDQ